MSKFLMVILIVIMGVTGCKKDPKVPCGQVGQICCAIEQGEHSSGKTANPSSLKISWRDENYQNNNRLTYTVILTDIKTKKALFIGITNGNSISAPVIPDGSFNIKVISHPCEEIADVDIEKIIVGDIQCIRPKPKP